MGWGGGFGKLLANYGSSSSACFYITASSAFLFFSMSTHHVAKTWSFLKGHGRGRPHVTVPGSRPSSLADRWLSPGLMSLSRVLLTPVFTPTGLTEPRKCALSGENLHRHVTVSAGCLAARLAACWGAACHSSVTFCVVRLRVR